MSQAGEYAQLRSAGFPDAEIQEYMRPTLEEAGFADQEINAYFLQHQTEQRVLSPWEAYGDLTPLTKGFEEAGKDNFFLHGLQGSVSGLWTRGQMPDAASPEALEKASARQRLSMSLGSLIGDLPTIVAGAAMGALGGPAAPVTVPAGAMALTEGIRASYMARIASGHTDDFFYLDGLAEVLKATAKGGVIGGATGGAGALAGRAASALGASALQTTGAVMAAETATMPTVAASLEGKLPHPMDFVDAALFIGTLRGVHGLKNAPKIVPRLREIYARIGKLPEEVAEAARKDPTVLEDLLSQDKVVPEAFIREIEREVIYNDSRSVKVEAVKTDTPISLADRPQLYAYMESLKPEEVKALKSADPDRYLAVLKAW